ncbi:MAG: type II/IV secretion system ATPase subunit [Candidatus Diapherotrites archaeon]|nr:type II/IV secretion system ATPase subunit [Candidatus Diapherotrites archaeon]
MDIGGFKVGDYVVKDEAGKRHLVFDCRNCVYGASMSDDPHCRFHAIAILSEIEADLIICAEVYERVYDEDQTKLLVEAASLRQKFNVQSVWSYKHLAATQSECEQYLSSRHDTLVKIAHDLIAYDPLAAYLTLLNEIKVEKTKMRELGGTYLNCTRPYIQTLDYIRKNFEATNLIQKTLDILTKLKEVPATSDIYKLILEAEVKPSFIGSRLLFKEIEQLELLDEYSVLKSNVQVFKHPNRTEALYFVNPPEYSLPPEQYFVMSKTKEVVAGYQPGKISLSTVAKSRRYFERIYESTIKDVARHYNVKLANEELAELAEIVARYTVGYGILEILLSDRKLTDIYLDAPIGQKPLYVVHSEYGQCQTNILYTKDEAEGLVSKMRAMSGRPFDEAHPVLDFDLPDLETRTAVIGPPLSPDGVAFAFRLHKTTPWTLAQFLDVDFLNPLAAGMISFFIDTQASTLITGSRGSGKTSLLTACILEILQNIRIIVQEDTLEIPVPYLKNIGFNIQRLKTRSPISVSKTESEVAPDEALRTALRLGDSALVVGEVRSKEARVLYEAMRVGAAGNIVIGTVHGESAYSVWDRVVNDLGVPTTSFKATDLVVVARPIRFAGSLKKTRRVVQLTEVKKHWVDDPEREGGLLDLMLYDAKKDNLELMEDNLKESELFAKISRSTGLTMKQMWEDIKMRGSAQSFLVELRRKHNIPKILEAENTIICNNKLILLKEQDIRENGKIDYNQVLGKWKYWMQNNFLQDFVKAKPSAPKKG